VELQRWFHGQCSDPARPAGRVDRCVPGAPRRRGTRHEHLERCNEISLARRHGTRHEHRERCNEISLARRKWSEAGLGPEDAARPPSRPRQVLRQLIAAGADGPGPPRGGESTLLYVLSHTTPHTNLHTTTHAEVYSDRESAASGRFSGLSVFRSESVLCGAFVWARRALSGRKRRFPARGSERDEPRRRHAAQPGPRRRRARTSFRLISGALPNVSLTSLASLTSLTSER
jgi:hypothetical protein